jgi:hypothetical protein
MLPMLFTGDGVTNIRLLREIAIMLIVSPPLTVLILVGLLTAWSSVP